MRHSKLFLFLSIVSFMFLTAFSPAEQTGATPGASWSDLVVVFVIIFVAAIAMIVQSGLTPQAVARYGLDEASHGHSDHEEAGH